MLPVTFSASLGLPTIGAVRCLGRPYRFRSCCRAHGELRRTKSSAVGCFSHFQVSYDEIMSFTIDEALLPATLTAPPMTDREFADFCAEHPDLFFEMTAEGEILVMPPTFSLTSIRNGEITRQLARWAAEDRRGVVGESSGGFVLPNGARRSPDASWIA